MDMAYRGGYNNNYRKGNDRDDRNWRDQLEYASSQMEREYMEKKPLRTFVVHTSVGIEMIKAAYWRYDREKGNLLEFKDQRNRWIASFNLDNIDGWHLADESSVDEEPEEFPAGSFNINLSTSGAENEV